MIRFLRLSPLLLGIAAPVFAEIDFVHQVVPILKEHCTECHGGEEAEGGFSMNTRNLFLDDDTAVPGEPGKSYFLELIGDPDPDFQMPPEKNPRVPAEHVAVLERWVAEGMEWEPGYTFGEDQYEPPLEPRRPELPAVTDGRDHPVDRFIDAYLAERELPRPAPADESSFLRRAHLDLVGLLPEPDAVLAFGANEDPDKFTDLVDDLLSRDLDYADHWLTFWNDLLRNDYAGTGFITGGRKQISAWLYDSLKSNKPFDEFTRELIAPPTADSAGFIDGIEWRGDVSAGQTLPIQFAQSLSQSFLGINMKCASCHDSFIDRWKLSDAYGLAAIYAEEEIEMHRCDKPTGETAKAAWLFPELGEIDPDAPKGERLSSLAALMTHPANGRFARTIVNRLWAQLMGRGIVHPLDAMQTEPWNTDLLDWLAADFQEHGYDLKRTLGLVATSAAYRSATEKLESREEGGDYTYRGPRTKRLTAEQFTDALWQLTGTAPAAFDAPVIRGIADAETVDSLGRPSSWIWGSSAGDGPPPAGEEVLLRRDFRPEKPVKAVGIVASVDNGFTAYLNAKPILGGKQWNRLEAAAAGPHLKDGVNRLFLLARNGGETPNPAGAFCAIRLVYEDGTDEVIVTDERWQVAADIPEDAKPGRWKPGEIEWESATPVSLPTWSKIVDPQVGRALATASAVSDRMVRASLLTSDFLMRSLGRPHRDQIVTSRPNEISTLEAIDLSNNATLTGYLQRGAEKILAEKPASSEALVDSLYLSTLTRHPTGDERDVLLGVLGDEPSPDTLADVLWVLTLTPEFLLVR
ncbi:MAG: DUF1549 domain-containing protein [Verrucomicrobiales bacterium]